MFVSYFVYFILFILFGTLLLGRLSSSCCEWELLFVAVDRFLIAVVSSCCRAWALGCIGFSSCCKQAR